MEVERHHTCTQRRGREKQKKALTLCRQADLLIKYSLVTGHFKRVESSTP